MPEVGYLMPEPSWDLRIFVPNLQVERVLRVNGNMHIGGIMLKLVEELDVTIDWSDFAFWWPKKNCWLTKTRQTLNLCGVAADSYLNFIPMHKQLKVQLPDLSFVDARIDFSVECMKAVQLLCKELGIRHSEELSFTRPLNPEHLKKNHATVGVTTGQRAPTSAGQQPKLSPYGTLPPVRGGDGTGTIDTRCHSPDITSTLSRHASYRGFTSTTNTTMLSDDLKNLEISNNSSFSTTSSSALLYPKSLIEKARLNAGWLDSHLSLYQQNVRDYDTLQLRFKYREFYDLNPKLDMARINQIYEQAKWSILTEETRCSQSDKMRFSSLQHQVEQQASSPIPERLGDINDDIDAAITELQMQLEGRGVPTTHYRAFENYQDSGSSRSSSATECKLDYIKAWQSLPDYGIHMFVVKFGGNNKEEILGIASDRLIRIDPNNGEHLRVWPYNKMKTWRINWDSKLVSIESEDGEMSFSPLSADCKIPHEFIGGYVFLSMRSKNNNQTMNEDLFYKLTRGWDD